MVNIPLFLQVVVLVTIAFALAPPKIILTPYDLVWRLINRLLIWVLTNLPTSVVRHIHLLFPQLGYLSLDIILPLRYSVTRLCLALAPSMAFAYLGNTITNMSIVYLFVLYQHLPFAIGVISLPYPVSTTGTFYLLSDLCISTGIYLTYFALIYIHSCIMSLVFGVEITEIANRILSKMTYIRVYLQGIFSKSHKPRSSMYRALFLDSSFPKTKQLDGPTTTPNHSHDYSASLRRAAITFSNVFASSIAKKVYMYQESPTDQINGTRGYSYHHWMKDVGTLPRFEDIGSDDVITIIDVDYYLDMPALLAQYHEHTFILYTFLPNLPGFSGPEVHWSVDENNVFTCDYSGGQSYEHEIWDWNRDIISVRVANKLYGFQVVRRQVADCPYRYLIMITPYANTYWNVREEPLQRFKPANLKYAAIVSRNKENAMINICQINSTASCSLDLSVYHALKSSAEQSKNGLTLQFILMQYSDLSRDTATILRQILNEKAVLKPAYSYPIEESVLSYDYDLEGHETEPNMTAFMTPIINGAFVPANTLANESQCIKGRCLKETRKAIPSKYYEYLLEFATWILQETGPLEICDTDEVFEKQSRPSQKRILEDAAIASKIIVKRLSMFMKRESYPFPNNPRPVEGESDELLKMIGSQVQYAVTRALKSFRWYGPGKKPLYQAQRVAYICEKFKKATETDFENFDKNVEYVHKEIFAIIVMNWFNKSLHDVLNIDMHALVDRKIIGKHGSKYEAKSKISSGITSTSSGGSLYDAQVVWCAYRSSGKTIAETIDLFTEGTVLYGDDSISQASVESMLRVSKVFNMPLKVKSIISGDGQPVSFLSRLYSQEVFFGSPDSCADIPRQLSKLHVTCANFNNLTLDTKLVKCMQKAIEKAVAFTLTDKNTPVLGPWAGVILRVAKHLNYEIPDCCNEIWNSQYASTVQYPNDVEDWAVDLFECLIPDFDLDSFIVWMNELDRSMITCGNTFCTSPDHHKTLVLLALSPPLCCDRSNGTKPPKGECVVNGELRLPEGPQQIKTAYNGLDLALDNLAPPNATFIYAGAFGGKGTFALVKCLGTLDHIKKIILIDPAFRTHAQYASELRKLPKVSRVTYQRLTTSFAKSLKTECANSKENIIFYDDVVSPRYVNGRPVIDDAQRKACLESTLDCWNELGRPLANIKLPPVAATIPSGVILPSPAVGRALWENRLLLPFNLGGTMEYDGVVLTPLKLEPENKIIKLLEEIGGMIHCANPNIY